MQIKLKEKIKKVDEEGFETKFSWFPLKINRKIIWLEKIKIKTEKSCDGCPIKRICPGCYYGAEYKEFPKPEETEGYNRQELIDL